jgi:hypothetical protein
MLQEQIMALMERINGCTFASLDATTRIGGLRRVVTNERVLLFTNKNTNGYENRVRRLLEKAGKNPDHFRLGDLQWGTRIPNTPLIEHRGFIYLQTVLLQPGREEFFMPNGIQLTAEAAKAFIPRISQERLVAVHTYAIENIRGIRLLGESLTDEEAPRPRRPILKIRS